MTSKNLDWIAELKRLTSTLEGCRFIDEASQLEAYADDRSLHHASMPDAAVIPRTPQQVAAVVAFCHQRKVPMTVRGAGSGLEGGCIPYAGGVVLSTEALDRVELDLENSLCWVGAGVKKLALDKALQRHGRLFGPDPSSNPSLGGMASTSGSGMTTLRYGTTRENIAALLVVTPEGRLVQTRRGVRKSSTGLDLTNLYCGSEGTLGVIVELLLRVHPRPSMRSGALLTFAETAQAVQTVVDFKTSTRVATLTRCELLNAEAVRCSNKFYACKLQECPTLLLEFTGDDPGAMQQEYEEFHAVAGKNGAASARYLSSGEQLDEVWEARRGCYLAAFRYRGVKGDKVHITDVCVPITRLTECVMKTEAEFAQFDVPCLLCAHIGDGNFHLTIPFNTEEEKIKVEELNRRLVDRALSVGGTVSGEHGVGIGKIKYLIKEHGEHHCDIQLRIKKALDPLNLLNPGKFYPSTCSSKL